MLKDLNHFLTKEIIFHPMGKGIVLEFFYFVDQIYQFIENDSNKFFLVNKILFDFL